jgi:hypothetical protein
LPATLLFEIRFVVVELADDPLDVLVRQASTAKIAPQAIKRRPVVHDRLL